MSNKPQQYRTLVSPTPARHAEISMIFSADDENYPPSNTLIEIALSAAREAQSITLSAISARLRAPPYYPDVWPGEHYRLLAALVKLLKPTQVIEIGTATGLSALSMKYSLPPNSNITTFDIIEWQKFADTCLRADDFQDGRLIQKIDDLSQTDTIQNYASLISEAQLIFLDAAKDGVGEYGFIENLKKIKFKNPPLLVFDDIRLWNMLKFWRELKAPKLDITSFGHWSGTGLVEWPW